MTKIQARDLQETWHELGSPICEHRKIDLERSEDGYVTGKYRCMACGDAVSQYLPHPFPTLRYSA